MITINDCKQANQHSYKGKFTDVKPVNCAPNSIFFQLNGGIFFYWTGTNWRRIGS